MARQQAMRSVAAMIAASALWLAPAWGDPTSRPIDDAIAHLGDPDPAARDRAVKTLRDAGADAREALKAAAQGDDPEVAARARDLLRSVPANVPAIAPDDDAIAPALMRYRASAPEAKRQIIAEMANAEPGLRALAKLWLLETDPDLRGAIFEELVKQPSVAAGALLIDGNQALAEQLLGAAVDRQMAGSVQAYAAYWLCRGKLDQAIRQWSSRGGLQPPDVWAEQVLSGLYRAKTDAPAALTHARASGDADLLRETQLWAGRWTDIANGLPRDRAVQTPQDVGFQAVIDAIAGDDKAVDLDLAKLSNMPRLAANAQSTADIMLLAGRADEAVEALKLDRQFARAYELLITRERYDDAAAMLASQAGEKTEEAIVLRCAAAKTMARLGRKAECADLIARVEKENAEAKLPEVSIALAEAQRAAGMMDKAWQNFADGLEAGQGQARAYWYIARAFPEENTGVDWSRLWFASRTNRPNRPLRELFDRIRQAYDGSMPLEELTAAIKSMDLSLETSQPYVDLAWVACRRYIETGREAQGLGFAEECAAAAHGCDLYLHLGDYAARKKDWPAAIRCYGLAWRKDPASALALSLQGWAMAQGGQYSEGHEKMELAHLLPVGNETARGELLKGLLARGIEDGVSRETDVLIRTAHPMSMPNDIALRLAAERSANRGEAQVAAGMWQRAIVDFTSGAYLFRDQPMYLYLSNSAHRAHARALLDAGDWDGAQREIKICLTTLPGDIQVPIDIVPDLDQRGKHREADALFAQTLAAQQADCDRFPDAANEHNQIAWLAALCHRDLDKALLHARRAVELSPKSTAYIDTLAEVYFQRGDYDSALAEMRKCIALEPEVARHRMQIARFEAAKKNGVKPDDVPPPAD